MDTESLQDISVEKIVNALAAGTSIPLWKLPRKFGNTAFKQFWMKSHEEKWSEACLRLKDLFVVSEMDLNGKRFGDNQCDMVFAQNLKELALRDLNQWNMFHKGHREQQHLIIVNIIEVLEKLLNPESRANLLSLTIDGDGLDFQPNRFDKLATLLPSLLVLKLQDYFFTVKEFRSICNSFTSLKSLDISGARIPGLEGISGLINLEVLDISIVFEDQKELEEIFTLRKLRVLIISNRDGDTNLMVNTLQLYLLCEKVLPELTYMQCCHNHITKEMLNKLVETHPKLTTVNIIGTPLSENPPTITKREVKLLTTSTFTDCLISLKEIIDKRVQESSIFRTVFNRMESILRDQYYEISREKLSLSLKIVCEQIKLDHAKQKHYAQLLKLICRMGEAGNFSISEQQLFAGTCLKTVKFSKDHPHLFDTATNVCIREVLLNFVTHGNSNENVDAIVEEAANSLDDRISGLLSIESLSILRVGLARMSKERGAILARDLKHIDNVLQSMFHCVRNPQFHYIIFCHADVLIKWYLLRNEKSVRTHAIDARCIVIVLIAIEVYKHVPYNPATLDKLLVVLCCVIDKTNDGSMSLLLDKERFPAFLAILNQQGTEQQKTAFYLFHMLRTKKTVYNGMHYYDITNDFTNSLREFVPAEDSGLFDGLSWVLSKCELEMTKDLCQWIIRKYRDGEDSVDDDQEADNQVEYPLKRRKL